MAHLLSIIMAKGTRYDGFKIIIWKAQLKVCFFALLKLLKCLCSVVAICDWVHNVQAKAANSIWKSFLKHE